MVFAVLAALSFVLVGFHAPLLRGFANLFRVDNPLPSDAIVLLLGGPDTRPIQAARLYQEGLAPRILLGTSTLDPNFCRNETEQAIADMTRLGVPRSAIVVLPHLVTSTREEAQEVFAFGREHPMKRVTVVTTAFHTSRARWIFRKILGPSGIDVRVSAARHTGFDENDWYRSDEGMVLYFSEAIKTLYYRLKY